MIMKQIELIQNLKKIKQGWMWYKLLFKKKKIPIYYNENHIIWLDSVLELIKKNIRDFSKFENILNIKIYFHI